jgi:hypothetical protein
MRKPLGLAAASVAGASVPYRNPLDLPTQAQRRISYNGNMCRYTRLALLIGCLTLRGLGWKEEHSARCLLESTANPRKLGALWKT